MKVSDEKKRLEEIAKDFTMESGLTKKVEAYFIEKIKKDLKKGRLLEIGCADGYLSKMLSEFPVKITAIDGSKKLIDKAEHLFSVEELTLYFRDLVEHTEDIWGMLENFSDTIDAIHESHVSLLNLRSNQIMRTFTLFTSIIFTLTLVVSVFGARLHGTPISDWNYGFWWEIGVLLAVIFSMLGFFKWRKWL